MRCVFPSLGMVGVLLRAWCHRLGIIRCCQDLVLSSDLAQNRDGKSPLMFPCGAAMFGHTAAVMPVPADYK